MSPPTPSTGTPSSDGRPTLAIVGSGIAGLTAALELARDFRITLFERRSAPGGKCRSWMSPESARVPNVPAEHGWRFFNATYHNLFDTLRRIPSPVGGSCFDRLRRKRQRPGTYLAAAIESHGGLNLADALPVLRSCFRLLRFLVSSSERLEARHGAIGFDQLMMQQGEKNLLYHLCQDFLGTVWSAEKQAFDLDVTRNMLDNFLVNRMRLFTLDGPTSETLIEPWVVLLRALEVDFRFDCELTGIHYDAEQHRVAALELTDPSQQPLLHRSDYVLSAIPEDRLLSLLPDAMRADFPGLERLTLVERVWQNGVQIYTLDKQRVKLNIFMGHPWKLTVVSHAENWHPQHDFSRYGNGVSVGAIEDVLSFVISEWHTAGPVTGKSARLCSAEEIYQELCSACEADPRVITNFDRCRHVPCQGTPGQPRAPCLVDDALHFSCDGSRVLANEDRLVSYPAGAYRRLPSCDEGPENFFLASTFCHNDFGCCDTMEGANETGRRAACALLRAISSKREVRIFHGKERSPTMWLVTALRRLDAALFSRFHRSEQQP